MRHAPTLTLNKQTFEKLPIRHVGQRQEEKKSFKSLRGCRRFNFVVFPTPQPLCNSLRWQLNIYAVFMCFLFLFSCVFPAVFLYPTPNKTAIKV